MINVYLIKNLKDWEDANTIGELGIEAFENDKQLIYVENEDKYICHEIKKNEKLSFVVDLIDVLIKML